MSHTLERHADDLWSVRAPLKLRIGDIGTRMTVIRLWDGSLILHSPVEPEDTLREEIDRIGEVRWIVGPSRVHHFFLGHWKEAYPKALLCGAPGLDRKRKDLAFDREIDAELVERWNGEVETRLFRGAPQLTEVVFLHPASRSLILTDLCFNVQSQARNQARIFHVLVGATDHFGPHRLIRAFIRDKQAARESVDAILAWDFDRVLVTHGEILETGGHAAFEQAFEYLG